MVPEGPDDHIYPDGAEAHQELKGPTVMPPKNGENGTQVKVRLSKDMLECVDDYRFAQRLDSRTQAIVSLIAVGLSALKVSPSNGAVSDKPAEAAQGGSSA